MKTPGPVTAETTIAGSTPSWNPLKCSGTDLPKNLTIMVKTLAIAVLVVNHVRILPDPWLPFIPFLDRFPPELFQKTLQALFLVSALAIVFNRRLRLFSLIIGATMLVAVVSSKAYYGNNKTFCGLMFLLAGLYKPGTPNFFRWQLAITYFGAGLNKLLDPDWHTGVFFENWAVNRLHQSWYMAVNSRLPALVLARFMCWTTIVTELGIVPCLFVPQLNTLAVFSNVLFQASLCLFTGTTFTLFFYSMTACSLALVRWPDQPAPAFYDPSRKLSHVARRFFTYWDLDGTFHWNPLESPAAGRSWIYLFAGKTVYSGFRAVQMIVLLNPITYFVLAAAIAALESTPADVGALLRRVIVGGSLLLLTPPVAWAADRFSGRGSLNPNPLPGSLRERFTA
ncbi:MAG: hypothetical protein ACJ746_10995 [Bryobacteraceae bacterium]